MIVEGTRWVQVHDPRLAALAEGRLVRVVVRKKPLAFVRMDGALHALIDQCPHQGRPLTGGWVDNGHVVCPFHLFHFDPRTGVCKHGMTVNAQVFPVEEREGRVRVGFPYTTISLFGWKPW